MQDTWVRSLGQEDYLKKGVATHPSSLARRIPWAGEPGGLQSKGSQRVDWPKQLSMRVCAHTHTHRYVGFRGGSDGKESTCNVGDLGLILGLGRPPGGGLGNLLQHSCLENPHGQRSLVGYIQSMKSQRVRCNQGQHRIYVCRADSLAA